MAAPKLAKKIADDQAQGATRGFLEELFQDYYKHRYDVYKMNFVRGIVFGFGSVIGGTIMVALLLWLISFFSELPFLGDISDSVKQTVEGR